MKFPQNVAVIEFGPYDFVNDRAEENLVYHLPNPQFIYTVNARLNTPKPGMAARIRELFNPLTATLIINHYGRT